MRCNYYKIIVFVLLISIVSLFSSCKKQTHYPYLKYDVSGRFEGYWFNETATESMQQDHYSVARNCYPDGKPYINDDAFIYLSEHLGEYKYYCISAYIINNCEKRIVSEAVKLSQDYGKDIILDDPFQFPVTWEPGDKGVFTVPLYVNCKSISDEQLADILKEMNLTFLFEVEQDEPSILGGIDSSKIIDKSEVVITDWNIE